MMVMRFVSGSSRRMNRWSRNEICHWVFQQNGKVVSRRTIRRLRLESLTITNETESNKHAAFDADINESLRDYIAPAPLKPARELFDTTNNFDYDEDDEKAFTNTVP